MSVVILFLHTQDCYRQHHSKISILNLHRSAKLPNLHRMCLKLICYQASGSGRVVEHLPHYPKVNGLSPTPSAGSKRKTGEIFYKVNPLQSLLNFPFFFLHSQDSFLPFLLSLLPISFFYPKEKFLTCHRHK
jgi:hypothetical protein